MCTHIYIYIYSNHDYCSTINSGTLKNAKWHAQAGVTMMSTKSVGQQWVKDLKPAWGISMACSRVCQVMSLMIARACCKDELAIWRVCT